MNATEYLVWSNEHKAWWGPNRSGYRLSIDDAGRYTREEARQEESRLRAIGMWESEEEDDDG